KNPFHTEIEGFVCFHCPHYWPIGNDRNISEICFLPILKAPSRYQSRAVRKNQTYNRFTLIFRKCTSDPCPRKAICPVVRFSPGCSLWSNVPFLDASARSPSTITAPFSVTLILLPLI